MKTELKVLFFSNLIAAMSYSMQTPLYPEIANGFISHDLVGLVFSIFAVANLLFIPIINHYIPLEGKYNLLYKMTMVEVS
jgi:hypothetical protein